MYRDFLGLAEKPFKNTPDPAFFYSSRNHRQALATLGRAIRDRCGLVLLSGEIGTGKTTICHHIAETTGLDCGYLFNPHLTELEFLERVNSELGVPIDDSCRTDPLTALKDHLVRQHADGRVVVIFVDEAHRLGLPVLEQILILYNLQLSGVQLLQIVLSGQPELLEILQLHRLASLNQRIGVRCHLEGMSRSDTIQYINHRLDKGGCRIYPLFTTAALEAIWRASRGTPRLINQVCERALVEAYQRGIKRIGPREVQRVVRDPLYRSLFASTGWRWSWKAAFYCLVVGLTFGGGLFFSEKINQQETLGDRVSDMGFVASTTPEAGSLSNPIRREGPKTEESHLGGAAAMAQQDVTAVSPQVAPRFGSERAVTVAMERTAYVSGNGSASESPAMGVIPEDGSERVQTPPNEQTDGMDQADKMLALETAPILSEAKHVPEKADEQLSASLKTSAHLPGINLSAIAWDEDKARRLVVLNDEILHEGEFCGDARVLRIHPEYVVLLYGNEQFTKRIHAE